jgi:hypothetical protein
MPYGRSSSCGLYSPTLTAVLPSSSENLLPASRLLLTLIRLALRFGRIPGSMLIGRCLTATAAGDPGGEVAMLPSEALRERMVGNQAGIDRGRVLVDECGRRLKRATTAIGVRLGAWCR